MSGVIDEREIQGIIKRGYAKLPGSAILLVSFGDIAGVKNWLQNVLPRVTPATDNKPTTAVHIAFSHSGLLALAKGATFDGLSHEFIRGPATPEASRILGDAEGSAPSNWLWGGPGNPPIDAVVILYASNEEIDQVADAELALLQSHSLACSIKMVSRSMSQHEHFGFRDGVSQPFMEGFGGKSSTGHESIKPGEFVLGYPTEYDSIEGVALHAGGNVAPDFGKNGTYLVVRQLGQDVPGFWQAVTAAKPEDPVGLASRMVGRDLSGTPIFWPAGKPHNPSAEPPFSYADLPFGGCPVGAHIRRSNPRDAIPGIDDKDESIRIGGHHRILRRGRSYGEPITREEAMEMAPNYDRGLFFIGINANIRRQFEFIVQTWLNNPKFGGLFEDVDFVGSTVPGEHTFTDQRDPICRRFRFAREVILTRGTGYFFMPSISALKTLATL